MAATNEVKSVELTVIDRLWIKKALAMQAKSLERSLANEIVGSEIFVLRRKEIESVGALILKFS